MRPEVLVMHSNEASERDKSIFGLALGTDGEGWDFRVGDPEIYANTDKLVVPGGKALDLGMGSARSSLTLAMYGMEVHGYDLDEDDTSFVNRLAREYGLPIHGEVADITEVDFGDGTYDTVLLSQTFIHFPTTEAAFGVLDKAIRALKPGGWLYLRAVGTQDEAFVTAAERYTVPSDTDPNVYYEFCGCSGGYREEAHLYFDAIGMMGYLENNGMRTELSELMPTKGAMNVKYAEDWHVPIDPDETRQMITLMCQKKPA